MACDKAANYIAICNEWNKKKTNCKPTKVLGGNVNIQIAAVNVDKFT